jgi:hypothetical protein
MSKTGKATNLFKITAAMLFSPLLIALITLFFFELYLNKENNMNFNGSYSSTDKVNRGQLLDTDSEGENKFSEERVTFNRGADLSDEVWSRESYLIESIRGRDDASSNFHQGYISDFFKANKDNFFLENRGGSKEDADYFKLKANTLPLDASKKNILIVGDSFVAGQNSIDENRIFYKIFADKLMELHKDHYFNIISAGRNGWGFYDYVLNAINLAEQIDIDYLVIGFLPNDWRNADIGILRGEWRSKGGNNGLEYINCINGGVWFSKYLLNIYNFFPKSSKALIMRYCDKYLNNTEGDKQLNNEEALDLFKDSLINLEKYSKRNGFEVIFMPLNPMENSGIIRDGKIYKLIKEMGFDIIPSTLSDDIIKERSKIGWVNPIDWHPSVFLSYAYGMDMFNYFVERFNIDSKEEFTYKNYIYDKNFDLFNYVSSIKPIDLNYQFGVNEMRLDNIGKEMFSTTSDYYQFLPSKENEKLRGKVYPEQSTLCAKINRPHLEMALNKNFIENQSFTIKNNHKVNSIVIGGKSYDNRGEEIYGDGYILLPGESVVMDNEVGLIIASSKEGCNLDEEIKLPEFDVSIKK